MRKSSIRENPLIKDHSFIVRESNDFNEWVSPSRQLYGKEGCFKAAPDTVYEPIELQGLAHPGCWNHNGRG